MSVGTLKLPLTPYDVCRYNFFCTGKWLFGGPLQWRPGLSPGLVCVGCVVEKVALGQAFPLSALLRQWSILMYLSPTNLAIFLSRNTNKMQLCNRIYYSKVYWRLNLCRAAHRSSSGALNCIRSLWFIYPCAFPLSLGNDRSPHGYINRRLQIQFRAPYDERYAARNMLSLP
jgi:hypothetical protein